MSFAFAKTFSRDDSGNIIPEKATIKIKGIEEEIFIIPLTRGEVKKITSGFLEVHEIEDLVFTKLKKPYLTENELNHVKPDFVLKFIEFMYEISGIKVNKSTNKPDDIEEDDFAKNLKKVRSDRQEDDLILFLHEQGYNYFNINSLTYTELNRLVETWNRRQDKVNKGKK
jgi:hypothetical protein